MAKILNDYLAILKQLGFVILLWGTFLLFQVLILGSLKYPLPDNPSPFVAIMLSPILVIGIGAIMMIIFSKSLHDRIKKSF